MIKAETRKYDMLYSKPVSEEVAAALKECERVSNDGGSFEIEHRYRDGQWRTMITIILPLTENPDDKG